MSPSLSKGLPGNQGPPGESGKPGDVVSTKKISKPSMFLSSLLTENELYLSEQMVIMMKLQLTSSFYFFVPTFQGIPGELGAVGQIGPRVGKYYLYQQPIIS